MKKTYIVKLKETQAYIRNIDNKNINYTFDVKNAKKYEKEDAEKILISHKELEIVDYNKELYRIKNERFKLFVKALVLQENTEIIDEDINKFQKEIIDNGFLISCCSLKQKYPDNRLVDEMERIARKIEFKNHYKRNPGKEISETYDYDDDRQLEILKLAFNEKYVTKEILEEEIEIEEQ